MFKTKNNDKKNQLNYIKFLFDIQNKLIKFNWNLMENYKNTKKVDNQFKKSKLSSSFNNVFESKKLSNKLSNSNNN